MEILSDLTKIGFTEYEAKVYIALLRESPATGYQLSKASGVPRSMVYEALKRLAGRGAALESVEGRATLYRPLSPAMLLGRHQLEHERLVSNLQQGLGEMFADSSDNRVWSLAGRAAALSYAGQLIHGAQKELFLVLTDGDLKELRTEIAAAHERGVEVNALLTGSGNLPHGRVAYHPPLESELQGLTTTLLVESDAAEVLIASAGFQHKVVATVTRNTDLVLIARQFVWMELFTQRIYARLGDDLLSRLDPEDRQIFASLKTGRELVE